MSAVRAVISVACLLTAYAYYAATSPAGELPRALPASVGASTIGVTVLPLSRLQDPVLNQDFPDPAVIQVDGVFYAFSTNTRRGNIPAARSDDLVQWSPLPDAMPALAPWVQPRPNMVWAPEPIQIGNEFRMYYVAHDRASRRQCIGVATSEAPEGPYQDMATRPLVCPPGHERAIDPNPFMDGGQLYLYFSGLCCGEPNGIYALKLSPDGLTTQGQSSLVLKVGVAWEGSVGEAPTMLRHAGQYYLFYSANDYRDETYAVGYAVCSSPLGPCTKATDNPLLATGSGSSRAIGPGHQSIVRVGDDYWMMFHGWNGVVGYKEGGSRVLWLQPLSWRAGRPTIAP